MKYKIIISDTAKRQVATHISFLTNVSRSSAVKTKSRLIESFRSLSDMPERYPFFNEEPIQKNKYHKMFVESVYLVLYQIKDGVVYIDYVIDCRQDYGWLKK